MFIVFIVHQQLRSINHEACAAVGPGIAGHQRTLYNARATPSLGQVTDTYLSKNVCEQQT